jgi:3-oxoacyl-[acyl-carrier-protein] synthase-1
MSTPHPEGRGARLALEGVLRSSGLEPGQVDYINLHGTASRKNDEVEALVIGQLFPASTVASSTKGWTGHTLGAAGIIEGAITLLALEHGMLPGTLNTQNLDPVCGPQVHLGNVTREARRGLSLSFGFGGSNCALAFARSDVRRSDLN